jgi:hypothetical protein
MPNIRFSFLYRDAANYKTFSDLIFANLDGIPLDTVRAIVCSGCNVDLCFDPVKWGIPNIRTSPYDAELDHGWYEFEDVEETGEEPTDGRTVREFLEMVKQKPLLDV